MRKVDFPRRDEAYFDFVVSLKGAVAQHAYGPLKNSYLEEVAGETPAPSHSPDEIRAMMGDRLSVKFNRAVSRKAQEMMWNGVAQAYQPYEQEMVEWLNAPHPEAASTLTLNPDLKLPDYFAKVEFHIQPGSYHADGDMSAIVFEKGGSLYFRKTTTNFRVQRELAKKLPPGNYERILDIGCSDGGSPIAFKLEHPQAQVYAVDLAEPQLKLAYQQSIENDAPVHFSQQDAENLNFPDNHFDAVTCFILFHEMPVSAIRSVLHEARRVLKPGGIMYSGDVTPFRENEPFRSFMSSWQVEDNGEPYWREVLEHTSMPALFEEAGFENVGEFGVAASKVSPKFPWVTLGYKPQD